MWTRRSMLAAGLSLLGGLLLPATTAAGGNGGEVQGRLAAVLGPKSKRPRGILPYPPGTTAVLVLNNGIRVIILNTTKVRNLDEAAFLAEVEAEGMRRLDGTLVARKVEFDR